MTEITRDPFSNRLYEYALLMRLDKPIGMLLLLWPALWALWIAGDGHPSPLVLLVFVLGVVVMRSAGCVINDYADRDIDRFVKRTERRPLTDGRVTTTEALLLFVLLCAVAFGLVLLLNPFTITLSVGGLLLAAVYPFTKRYTHMPQVVLGAAFGWAVPMAFAAQLSEVPPLGWLLFVAAVVWAVIYDTMYAMVDRDDDLRIGVKSTAILFGSADRIFIGLFQVIFLADLALVGREAGLGIFWNGSLVAAAGFFVYQQWLIRNRDRMLCFRAFLNNNWLGLVVFVGVFLDYLARPAAG